MKVQEQEAKTDNEAKILHMAETLKGIITST